MVEELKACINDECRSADVGLETICLGGFVSCGDCGVSGPNDDPTGEKWNALPRRGDAVPVTNPDPDEAMLMQAAASVMRGTAISWDFDAVGEYGARAAMAALESIRARKRGE